jgi:hypothetical protein
VIDVSVGSRAVEFSATVFSGAIDAGGFVLLSDVSSGGVSGKGRLRLELPGLKETERKLKLAGLAVLRSIDVVVAGKLVAAVGIEVERPAGQCIFVRL